MGIFKTSPRLTVLLVMGVIIGLRLRFPTRMGTVILLDLAASPLPSSVAVKVTL